MAWFGRRRGSDEPTLEQLRRWHLLLLPTTVDVGQVDSLIRNRYPDARIADTRRARLGRHAAISGPHELEDDELRAVQVPEGWRIAYALEVEAEPDPEAFEDIGDPVLRAWWMRAFPRGKPFRDEGDAVDLALALARRLGGAVRAAGSGVLLEPDHDRLLDLTVWSGYWLGPDRLLELLGPVLPGAEVNLAVHGRHEAPHHDTPWSVDPLDPLGADLEHALGDPDHEIIDEVARQHDARALAGGVVLDGYALTAHGSLVVEVIQEDAVPDLGAGAGGRAAARRDEPGGHVRRPLGHPRPARAGVRGPAVRRPVGARAPAAADAGRRAEHRGGQRRRRQRQRRLRGGSLLALGDPCWPDSAPVHLYGGGRSWPMGGKLVWRAPGLPAGAPGRC